MMAGTMLQLGGYQFSIDNAAYQSLSRSSEYRWAAIEQVGAADALQFTGLGPDTITLQGVIYPHFKGGLDQLNRRGARRCSRIFWGRGRKAAQGGTILADSTCRCPREVGRPRRARWLVCCITAPIGRRRGRAEGFSCRAERSAGARTRPSFVHVCPSGGWSRCRTKSRFHGRSECEGGPSYFSTRSAWSLRRCLGEFPTPNSGTQSR